MSTALARSRIISAKEIACVAVGGFTPSRSKTRPLFVRCVGAHVRRLSSL
jgi:hypothetical protein